MPRRADSGDRVNSRVPETAERVREVPVCGQESPELLMLCNLG